MDRFVIFGFNPGNGRFAACFAGSGGPVLDGAETWGAFEKLPGETEEEYRKAWPYAVRGIGSTLRILEVDWQGGFVSLELGRYRHDPDSTKVRVTAAEYRERSEAVETELYRRHEKPVGYFNPCSMTNPLGGE